MAEHNDIATKYGTGRKTLKSYLYGLGLSLLLTFSAFYLVGQHVLASRIHTIAVLVVLAIAQLFAQVTCFLRFNTSPEGRWNTMPFIFTIFIVVILVGGSMWIMWNLNYYMMH